MTHHPSPATLLAHAAGRLPVAHGIVVRTHLALCAQCRAEAALGAAIGGTLLEDMPPAALAPDSLARVLGRLEMPRPAAAPLRPVPTTVEELATGRWWWIAPGMRLMPLLRRGSDDARLDLIKVAPGVRLPGHGHTGSELTCVLRGAFGDETGEYHTGDVAEGDEGLEHQPVALPVGEACVCLIATAGRLRAHDWLARLVQPLVGV
jgi:putative transcriptional regulator